MPERAVFDCSLFLQAVTSKTGPAYRCFQLVEQGEIILLLSPAILVEIEDVLSRPLLRAKMPALVPERVGPFLQKVRRVAVNVPNPPNAFTLPRDRDDEPYTDLAIAARAKYLVTWNDRHLTYLMRQDTPEGRDFCDRFPFLNILTPTNFLAELAK
jgi:putative PIN family toxin of toxin-antitoxin system